MIHENLSLKLARIIIASVGTLILGLLSYPIWAVLMVQAHYGPSPYKLIANILIFPFFFTLMMTVLIFNFGERLTVNHFRSAKRYLILFAIIILESIFFGLILKLLEIPYLWLDASGIFEQVSSVVAMIIIYSTIIIIAALVADAGVSYYNKCVLKANNMQNDIEPW